MRRTGGLSGDSDARTDVDVRCSVSRGEVIHEGFLILCANRQDYSVKRTRAVPINPILIVDYPRDRMLRLIVDAGE